jgi:hypothetical protein
MLGDLLGDDQVVLLALCSAREESAVSKCWVRSWEGREEERGRVDRSVLTRTRTSHTLYPALQNCEQTATCHQCVKREVTMNLSCPNSRAQYDANTARD